MTSFSNGTVLIPDLPSLGDVVQFHRKKAGMTQAELAKLAGIGKTAVFDIENSIKQPRLSTLLAIFKVLNISLLIESPLMNSYERHRNAKS